MVRRLGLVEMQMQHQGMDRGLEVRLVVAMVNHHLRDLVATGKEGDQSMHKCWDEVLEGMYDI